MAFEHPRLQLEKLIYPGPYALEAIEKQPKVRSFNLSDLPVLKGLCCWCNVSRIAPGRRRYCGQDCIDAALLFCHPQSPRTKMYVLLQLQDCTCVGCGEIFDEEIRQMIERKASKAKPEEKVSLGWLGYGTGDKWHVDHVIPIFRGGRGVCSENIQVLCVKCHLKKTARERRSA